jgi:hypothetical protein
MNLLLVFAFRDVGGDNLWAIDMRLQPWGSFRGWREGTALRNGRDDLFSS